MAENAKVIVGGYITIPQELRDKYELHPDAKVKIMATEVRMLLQKANGSEDDAGCFSNAPNANESGGARILPDGQIKISRELRYKFGLHPNAEVEISDAGDGLLIRKIADSENPVDLAVGSIAPGGIIDQLGGIDAYISAIRGGGPRGL